MLTNDYTRFFSVKADVFNREDVFKAFQKNYGVNIASVLQESQTAHELFKNFKQGRKIINTISQASVEKNHSRNSKRVGMKMIDIKTYSFNLDGHIIYLEKQEVEKSSM